MGPRNQFSNNTNKDIDLADLSSVRNSKPLVDDHEFSQKKCIWTSSAKIAILIGVLLILAAVGVAIGLALKDNRSVEPIGPVNRVSFGEDHYVAIGELEFKEKNYFSDDVSQKMILTQLVRKTPLKQGRLLQQDSQDHDVIDFTTSVNLDHVGFQLSFDSEHKLAVQVEPQKLFDYIMETTPDAARLLAEVIETDEANENATVQELQKELQKALIEELGAEEGSFEFQEKEVVDLQIDVASSGFSPLKVNGETIKDSRRLLMIRLLFLKKVFHAVKSVVHAVVKPVVEVIRNNGPMIGQIAGSVIGFAIGGPAGAQVGSQIGQKVGVAAQTFVQFCVPRDTLTVRCDGDAVKHAVVDYAKDYARRILFG